MPFIDALEDADEHHNHGAQLAYVEGVQEPPLLNETIGHRFRTIVERFPDRLAVKSSAESLTYSELDKKSDALAAALQKIGVDAGDRVATTLGSSIPHFVIIYACFKLGAILAPLNPSYSPQQTASAIKHVSASCYIVSSHISLPYGAPQSTRPLLESVLAECASKTDPELSEMRPLRSVLVVNNGPNSRSSERNSGFSEVHGYDELLQRHRDSPFESPASLDPDDTINLQFTSGTTSAPKAVELSHHNILNNAHMHGHCFKQTEGDRMVCTMPLYHCGGIVIILLSAMTYGASISLPCESFDALLTLRAIKEDRATLIHGVPTMFHAWLDLLKSPEFADHDFSHIRTGMLGASPILPTLRKALNDGLHLHDLANCYGMTELSPMTTQTRPSDPAALRISTCGRPIPHQKVRIAARDDPHRTLQVGEKGEVLGAGMVMKGYWKDAERTSEAICTTTDADGTRTRWMRTGDEGLVDKDGYLSITGRIKDIIIRGGENIYPQEIENALIQCPGVKRTSVVGLPDQRYGEIVAAFVVLDYDANTVPGCEGDAHAMDLRAQSTKSAALHPQNTSSRKRKRHAVVQRRSPRKFRKTASGLALVKVATDEAAPALTAELLRAWTRARLSRHLVPKYVFWVEQLPMNPTGKIEKFKLQAMAKRALR